MIGSRCLFVMSVTAFAVSLSTLISLSLPLQQRRKLVASSFADTFPDKSLVLDLMQLSKDIYSVDEEGVLPADAISDPKFEELFWLEAEFSTEVMIVGSQDDQNFPPVVVFRGSEERDDWLVNANIVLDKSKFQNAPDLVEVHRGFQNALFDQDVVGVIEEKVLELVGESGQVIVTGHSLGGANAHICAVYLADKYPNMKVTMINFGAPRFGNGHFKSWTEESLTNLSAWRYVYRADIVPRIIPDQFEFRHAGHLFAILRYSSEAYYRQKGEGDYEGAPGNWYIGASVRHHRSRTYLEFFKNKINSNDFWPTDFEKVPTVQCPWWNPWCW